MWRTRGGAGQPGWRLDGYGAHGGVFRPGELIAGEFRPRPSTLRLKRVSWNARTRELALASVPGTPRLQGTRFSFPAPDRPGAYVLVGSLGRRQVGCTLLVSAPDAPVAVVRPTWTEWGYHNRGFYRDAGRTWTDLALTISQRVLPALEPRIRAARLASPRAGRYPYAFPAHPSVDLSGFYEQNPRWRGHRAWSHELESIEGVWSEDPKSTWPLFAHLDALGRSVAVLTDRDLEKRPCPLDQYPVVLFFGAELMTRAGLDWFRQERRRADRRIVFWGMQGIGLKEARIDGDILALVGHKGKRGLSGEALLVGDTSWGNEDDQVFGASFPWPASDPWRPGHDRLVVRRADHAIGQILSAAEPRYVLPAAASSGSGLLGAGGEYFVANDTCEVIASLGDDERSLGIGISGPFCHVSPTYWPTFGAYQGGQHPEIAAVLDHLLT